MKETVDRLLQGYDIRLRPDFGGEAPALPRPAPRPPGRPLTAGAASRSPRRSARGCGHADRDRQHRRGLGGQHGE